MMTSSTAPLIVGIGGTLRPGSSTERALQCALAGAERLGARTMIFNGAALDIPLFTPHAPDRDPRAVALVEALRKADGVMISSPGYHGTISGHVKNALDYLEDLRADERPYLQNRAVGCISTAAGWQAAVTTLTALRGVVHALRGWPTPLGVAVNTIDLQFDNQAKCISADLDKSLETMAGQVVEFVKATRALASYSGAEP